MKIKHFLYLMFLYAIVYFGLQTFHINTDTNALNNSKTYIQCYNIKSQDYGFDDKDRVLVYYQDDIKIFKRSECDIKI